MNTTACHIITHHSHFRSSSNNFIDEPNKTFIPRFYLNFIRTTRYWHNKLKRSFKPGFIFNFLCANNCPSDRHFHWDATILWSVNCGRDDKMCAMGGMLYQVKYIRPLLEYYCLWS